MDSKNTFLLQDTEMFMRGELDNVTVAGGRILLDIVQGGHVPYGCYTSPAISLPAFDAVRVSWNAGTPPDTAVEAQARVLVDGNWSAWSSFGRWSPYLDREGARPVTRGPLVLSSDHLTLDSKVGMQVQLRIYLYTKDEKKTPTVSLLGVSVHAVDVIPAGGRPVNAKLNLMPYTVAPRSPALHDVMDLAICLTSLTNRWGADILPEEFALAMRDFQPGQDPRNLSFAAAAAGCWGFPAWACWADLALLRAEVRAGYGVIVALSRRAVEIDAGMPPIRYAALRGFANMDGSPCALLIDPWAGISNFDAETQMPLDEFLVAWTNLALCMRQRCKELPEGRPERSSVWLRHEKDAPDGLYQMYLGGVAHPLPDDFCGEAPNEAPGAEVPASRPEETGEAADAPQQAPASPAPEAPARPAAVGGLAWSIPDERPHATTAHRTLHFTRPVSGGIHLGTRTAPDEPPTKYTVYAIDPAGRMLVGDVMV